ncbi:MAG: hypothetical protein IMX00_05220 [Limnochordales bacterium]|nr:hypothetical protein [Limnochordales bacterium]
MNDGTSMIGRWLLAGLGLAALTREKAEEIIQDLVRRGKISREEARDLGRQIQERGESQWAEWRQWLADNSQRLFATAGLVTREELARLERKVAVLEERVDRLGTVQ